jgi:hypothetical protein
MRHSVRAGEVNQNVLVGNRGVMSHARPCYPELLNDNVTPAGRIGWGERPREPLV